jgi:predicted PurR-regulated permease PerM
VLFVHAMESLPPDSLEPTKGTHPAAVVHATPGQTRALGVLALGALLVLVRIALPVGVGLFLGALLAFTLEPIYRRLRARHWRPVPAALLCSLTATALVTSAVVGLVILFVTRGVELAASLPGMLGPGGGLRRLAERYLSTLHVDPSSVTSRLEEGAVSVGSKVAGFAAEAAGATFSGLLTLFFITLTAYFVMLHWSEIVRRAETALPFEARHTHALLNQFRKVGRQVLRGTVVTGFVQGAFAAVGYWITGVPDPFFFGALTAVASLVPAVGTLLVWIPIGVYCMATGRVGAGILELAFSAVFVGIVSDYVIRPRLVGTEAGVPAVLTFVSFFGGVEVFGLIGLILGPVVVTLAVAILKTYESEVVAARFSR